MMPSPVGSCSSCGGTIYKDCEGGVPPHKCRAPRPVEEPPAHVVLRCDHVITLTPNDMDYQCSKPAGHVGQHVSGAISWNAEPIQEPPAKQPVAAPKCGEVHKEAGAVCDLRAGHTTVHSDEGFWWPRRPAPQPAPEPEVSAEPPPAAKLEKLFDEHLAKYPPAEQDRMVASALGVSVRVEPPAEEAGEISEAARNFLETGFGKAMALQLRDQTMEIERLREALSQARQEAERLAGVVAATENHAEDWCRRANTAEERARAAEAAQENLAATLLRNVELERKMNEAQDAAVTLSLKLGTAEAHLKQAREERDRLRAGLNSLRGYTGPSTHAIIDQILKGEGGS